MNNSDLLRHYFPEADIEKQEKLHGLEKLTREWNEKINVISRKDTDQLFIHHILHALSIIKFVKFSAGTEILDVGTGGGYPGIPLAIMFPESRFRLIDGRSKKTIVAESLAKRLELNNVNVQTIRSEELREKFDIILGRAVTEFPEFIRQVYARLDKSHFPESGIYYWTGVNAFALSKKPYKVFKIEKVLKEEYFKGKYIFYYRRRD